jgi:UDP-N-acetylglucosamine 3-dehydrogenase
MDAMLYGCGNFGRNHLRILNEMKMLKGVVVSSEESRARIEKEHGVKAFIAGEAISPAELVLIATPPATHAEIIRRTIKDSHVLCEKPLALSAGDIISLKELALVNRKILMVGHTYRFSRVVEEAKKLIHEQDRIEFSLVGGNYAQTTGAIRDFLHGFDILDCVLGILPSSVHCKKVEKHGNFETYAEIEMEYGKTKVSMNLGWPKEAEKMRRMVIFQKNEKIEVELVSQTIAHGGKLTVIEAEEPLKKEITHFIDAVKGRVKTYPDADVALRIEKVISAAYESMRTKRKILVK